MALPAVVAQLAAHKAAALGAGAVAVALVARRQKNAGKGPTGTSVQPATAGGASAAYDSTSQDVYSSIEPQLAALQGQIANLAGQAPATAPAVPETITGAAASAYGTEIWRRDSAFAKLNGSKATLAPPSDLAAYGAARYGQNLFAARHADAAHVNTALPGANWTVGQALREQQAFDQGKLGAMI